MAKWREPCTECARLRAEAETSAAQRDEAVLRAQVAEAVAKDARDAAQGWRARAFSAESELARRDAAERNHTAAKLSAAQDMREGRG